MSIWRSQTGFTLGELLVAMAGVGLTLAAVMGIQQSGLQAYVSGASRLEVQQTGRIALERMAREIREATQLTSLASADLQFAGFKRDSAGNLVLDGSGLPVIVPIRYQRVGSELRRTQDTQAAETVVGGVDALTLTYRTAAGAVTTTPSAVRRIGISIRTRTEERVAAGSAGDTRYQAETSVMLRNLQ